MNHDILKDLFYGNIDPSNHPLDPDSEIKRKMSELQVVESLVCKSLDENQLKMFQDYLLAQNAVIALSSEQGFLDGFKLGLSLVFFALS